MTPGRQKMSPTALKIKKLLRFGYSCLVALLLIVTTWSFAIPLAESSVAPGTVTVSAQRRTIAHLEGGKIDELYVQAGDFVEPGQVLLELDDQVLQSELKVLQYQRYARQAKLDRLLAERQGELSFGFRPGLLDVAKFDLHVKELLEAEIRSFETRRQALEAKNALLEERRTKAVRQGKRLKLQLNSADRQLAIVREQAQSAEDLHSKGYGTKSKAIAFRREVEQLITQRLQIEAEFAELDSIIEDAKLGQESNKAEVAHDVERETLITLGEIAELDEKVVSVRARLDNLVITSTIRGVIVDLKVTSSNDVITPAAPILDIVPSNSTLMVEANVPPHEIEGIIEGIDVEVRFPAFAGKRVPVVTGEVALVSADLVDDESRQSRHYRVHVAVKDWESLDDELDILPGMPAEVIIRKRDRTLFDYIFAPITNHLSKAAL